MSFVGKNYIGHRKNYVRCRKNYIRHNPNYIRPFLRHLQPDVKQNVTRMFEDKGNLLRINALW